MPAVRPRSVCLVRRGSGYLHIGMPTGRGYDTACCNPFVSPSTRVWHGQDAEAQWRAKPQYRCPDCAALRKRGWGAIRRVTGW